VAVDEAGAWKTIAQKRSRLANELVRREADRSSSIAHDLRGFVQIVKLGTAELARRQTTPVNDGFDLLGELQQTADRVKTSPLAILGAPAVVANAIEPAIDLVRVVAPRLEIDVAGAPDRAVRCSAFELEEIVLALALDAPANALSLAVDQHVDADHAWARFRATYDGAVSEEDLGIASVLARRADGGLVVTARGVVIRLPFSA